jgi:hypothetical protein
MEHAVDALERLPHRRAIEHVGVEPLVVEALQVVEPRARPQHQLQVIPALGEQPRHVRSDEATAARYERLPHPCHGG